MYYNARKAAVQKPESSEQIPESLSLYDKEEIS